MAKRIFLSLFLCAFVFSFFCSTSSFALSTEQKGFKSRIDSLQIVLGMKRSDVYKKMKKPESFDAGDFICTYEKGLTEICFQPKADGDKAKDTDIVHMITAKMKASSTLTKDMVKETIGGDAFPFNGQLYVQKEGCTLIISYDESEKCTQVQLIKM
jgi:hypothetical protein